MEGTEDSSYLTLLNDGTHNYLLHTTEEALGVQDPSLSAEHMFTEIEDGSGGWSVGLPILMNGNLISEVADHELDNNINLQPNNNQESINLPTGLSEMYEDSLQNGNISVDVEQEHEETQGTNHQMKYPVEIPGKGFITADGLFIANDLLLQLKLGGESLNFTGENENNVNDDLNVVHQQDDMLINPKTLIPPQEDVLSNLNQENNLDLVNECRVYKENEKVFNVEHLSVSGDIIRLLNTEDGTVINISKEQLLNYNVCKNKLVSIKPGTQVKSVDEHIIERDENVYEMVKAYKCKKCSFLCEERRDMFEHWKTRHNSKRMQLLEEKVSIITPKEMKLKEIDEKNVAAIKYNNANGEVRMKSILKNNDQKTIYLCSECNYAYGCTEKLKNHMIIAHKLIQRPEENKTIVISNNNNSSSSNSSSSNNNNNNNNNSVINSNGNKNRDGKEKLTVAILEKRAKASKKIKCSIKGCDLRFALDEMRLRHEKCHVDGQKKQFKCCECDTKFSIWRVCSLHLWKCHKVDLGLFTCPMCSVFKASSAGRLLRHMAIHEDEKPYLCSECGKTFKQNSQLRNHQVLHKNPTNVPDWSSQQQCDICKKYFANSKSLKKHVQSVHDKFKPFICSVCGHKTARKAMLALHLRQHTGEKPHKCPMCEYKTGDHNSLRRHIMRHSGDTKYSCPHCSYTSIQSVSYKNHIASKHPGLGGSFFCSLCSYHTVNENAYYNHLVDHKNGLIKDNSNSEDNNEILSKVMKLVGKEKFNSNEKQPEDAAEDDETENYLLLMDHSNDAIDTGGITIPAGAPMNMTY